MMSKFKLLFGTLIIISTFFLGCSSNGGNNGGGNGNEFSSTQNVGDSANDFLSASNYSSLSIEVDYVEGFQPTQAALNNLRSLLQSRLNKTNISISLDDEIPSPGNSPYSAQEAFDVESCLMYFAVRTSGFMNNLTGGNIPELDAQCIQDLQANGGK